MAWKNCGIAACLLLAGCGGTHGVETYVGRVTDPGTDAVIGAVSDGAEITVYLCGGAKSYATDTHWFSGKVDDSGKFSLAADGFTITGDVTAGHVVTSAGITLSWTMAAASGEVEGVYESQGACRTGAIVGDFAGDGTMQLQGTWCDGAGKYLQVTPILPIALSARGIEAKVADGSSKTFFLTRVTAP
jgi:hypothetical protein